MRVSVPQWRLQPSRLPAQFAWRRVAARAGQLLADSNTADDVDDTGRIRMYCSTELSWECVPPSVAAWHSSTAPVVRYAHEGPATLQRLTSGGSSYALPGSSARRLRAVGRRRLPSGCRHRSKEPRASGSGGRHVARDAPLLRRAPVSPRGGDRRPARSPAEALEGPNLR